MVSNRHRPWTLETPEALPVFWDCTRGDYLKVYWEVQGPGPPGAINERSAWARELCGSRADAPPALYSPGPSLVLEFHTGAKQNNATGFVGTYSFIDRLIAIRVQGWA
uniref:SFRICE_026576 n=1 Tax=Spodoptera frugiperda TaxID=7108 RepID=A0A2H1WTI1_SPOFR